MPPVKSLCISASVLVLAIAARAEAAGPSAPNFGQTDGLMTVTGTPSPATTAVPDALRSTSAAPPARRPVAPGENPFAPSPAPAPMADGPRGSLAPAPAKPAAGAATVAVDAAGPGFQIDAPAAGGASKAAASDPDKVDEAALRYYASSRDLVRVGAEIRRLKALHPDWQPPTDLFADKAAVNETALWDLLAKKDFAGLDAAFAERAKASPGWKPSADLASKVEAGRGRMEIASAAGRGDWNGVVATAGKYPGILTCGNMDLLWSLGEGYARLQNFARSFDLYAYVLKTCDDPAERQATYQKAALLLPPEGAQSLAALGRPSPDGSNEFVALQFDPFRRQIGRIAAGEPVAAPDPAELQAFAAQIGRSRSQGDSLLFAWYLYAQKDFAGAADWFKAAAQLGPDPKAVEGYILSLRNSGQETDASALAFANRTRSPEIAKIYVELMSGRLTADDAAATLDEATMKTFSDVVDRSKSALGAQSLGWNYLAHERTDDARTWFRKSVEWMPTKEGVTGLAVVAARSKDRNELKMIKQTFADKFPELATLAEPAPTARNTSGGSRPASAKPAKKGGGAESNLMAQANAAFKTGDYKGAIALLDKRKAAYGREGGAELLRGWANLKLGRYEEARRVFKDENRRHSTKDSRFGIGAVSNEQYGMWE